MTKLDVITGLKGSGKTTLINWMLTTIYHGKTCALVQNELGKVTPATSFLQNGQASCLVMTGGCICCTMQTNLIEGIRKLMNHQPPDVILVEPSGIARASDVLSVCRHFDNLEPHIILHIVDGSRYPTASRVMGTVYTAPIRESRSLYINRLEKLNTDEAENVLHEIHAANPRAYIFTDSLDSLDPNLLLTDAAQNTNRFLLESSQERKKKPPVKIRL